MSTKSVFLNFDLGWGVWGCRSTNPLCMRVWTIYLQCRKRWRLLLRIVNFLLDHKGTHNMKGLIRSHVHFNKCRPQVVPSYTASSLHYVRFFPHTLCTKQSGLHKHAPTVREELCTLPVSSLRDPVTIPHNARGHKQPELHAQIPQYSYRTLPGTTCYSYRSVESVTQQSALLARIYIITEGGSS
jgi:hypothetical protein